VTWDAGKRVSDEKNESLNAFLKQKRGRGIFSSATKKNCKKIFGIKKG
jgi:hypothetical protein